LINKKKVKFGLWENGVRVKWFDRAEVELIEAGKYLDFPFQL
jgi:hypothetical protein